MNRQNLANLTTQYQSAYLVYCYKVMQYLQALTWLVEQQSIEVKLKSALGVKKLANQPHQKKPTLKSLKHQGKAKVSTIVAMGFPNGAMSAAFRVAFNELGGGGKVKSEREKLEDSHNTLIKRVLSDAEDPSVWIWLSKKDQETILAFEFMQTRTKKSYGYVADHRSADTFIRGEKLSSRNFLLEGYGMVKGGEFNYVSVGMMFAKYDGYSFTIPFKVVGWNAYQMKRDGGYSYNYTQMFTGSYWAAYGFQYYQENKND